MEILNVTTRVAEQTTNNLRSSGQIPAVIYGHGLKPAVVSVEKIAFGKVWRSAGESTLIDLMLDSKEAVKVLIQSVQKDPVKGTVDHVDFHQIRMDEKLTTEIPLKFVGEAPAVKEFGGILVRNLDHLKVECLPKDLVHEIEVDTALLKELNHSLLVKDIKLPAGIKVLMKDDEMIATVIPPRTEAELDSIKSEVKEDVSQIQKVETKKADEEAGDDKKSEAKK
ncbi:MAG: 50S ribosomal protein L25 [Patescibacteria group bacterium]